ncbi:MAG: hypothetical protein IJ719_12200 [Clostridia bacterium]|nr:hypothetical protein [Clostridia bacterium]
MKSLNFDAAFESYLRQWMKDNAEKFANNMDRLEEMVPDIYLEFLDTPQDFLSGETPATYFDKYDDPNQLISLMRQYETDGVPVPDLLLERIVDLGAPSEAALLQILSDPEAGESEKMTAVSLLREIGSEKPMGQYVKWITGMQESGDLFDLCAEALTTMGNQVVEPLLGGYPQASEAAKCVIADILCNFKGDARIFEILKDRFLVCHDQKALFASYLAKYGDERALPLLIEAGQNMGLDYLDFVEISNAIESLGGDPLPEREYSGDPYYDAMKKMEH